MSLSTGRMPADRFSRITKAEGEALAKKLNAGFIESSAKDNTNVGESTLPATPVSRDVGGMLTSPVKAFEVLLAEMQKEYNPAPEKKKSSWFSWGK